jgi:hypothetical protein
VPVAGAGFDALPGEGRMMISPPPTGARNGMPGFHDYSVYRGSKPLEVELPYECEGGCGRRVSGRGSDPKMCAVCRGAYGAQRGGK